MTSSTVPNNSAVAMCRVSVVARHTQMDVGLPADVPLASILSDIVDLVESRAPQRSELEPEPEDRTWQWTVAPVGKDPLPLAASLQECGIRDGDLLVLHKADAPAPPALFDDVIDAVATLQSHDGATWSATAARWTGYVLFSVVLAVAMLALWHARTHGLTPVVAGVPIALGSGAIVAGALSARAYTDTRTAQFLGVTGLVVLGIGAGLALPGAPGTPHVLLGCAVVAALAIPCLRLLDTGLTLHVALLTAAVLGMAAAGVALAPWFTGRQVAALVAVTAFFVIAAAPRLAISTARLPVPPVPTAGEPIDPGDIESRPTVSGVGAVGAMTLPAASRLAARADQAGHILTGITCGAAMVLLLSAVLMLPGGAAYRWQAFSLAVILGVIVAARSRSHSDLVRAAVLVTTGVLIVTAAALSLLAADQVIHFAVGLALLSALAIICLWAGVVVPRTEHSPVARRWVELVEYGLHIAIIPLLVWLLGVWNYVRNLNIGG